MFRDKLPSEEDSFGSGLDEVNKKKVQIILSVILVAGILLAAVVILLMVKQKQSDGGKTDKASLLPVHGHTVGVTDGEFTLTGILYNNKGNSVALITDGKSVYTVKEGEALGDTQWRVEAVAANDVTLTDGAETMRLSLTEEE